MTRGAASAQESDNHCSSRGYKSCQLTAWCLNRTQYLGSSAGLQDGGGYRGTVQGTEPLVSSQPPPAPRPGGACSHLDWDRMD